MEHKSELHLEYIPPQLPEGFEFMEETNQGHTNETHNSVSTNLIPHEPYKHTAHEAYIKESAFTTAKSNFASLLNVEDYIPHSPAKAASISKPDLFMKETLPENWLAQNTSVLAQLGLDELNPNDNLWEAEPKTKIAMPVSGDDTVAPSEGTVEPPVNQGTVTPEVLMVGETEVKTRKLGKLVSKATLQVGRIIEKVITKAGAASVLYPGTAMFYADLSRSEVGDGDEAELGAEPVFEIHMNGEEARLIEAQGYVKQAARFRDQIRDKTRTNTFRYVISHTRGEGSNGSPKDQVVMTEHRGLMGLEKFFKDYINHAAGRKDLKEQRMQAQAMLENLTFVGGKEYAEAARGLGEYWKAYLDEDPNRQICIMTNMSKQTKRRKSDLFLAEAILEGFSDEEIERYSGRIVTELEEITARPQDVKVVLLDDWAISGQQMRAMYHWIYGSSEFRQFAERLEVNLITSPIERINNGLKVGHDLDGSDVFLPVRAYYLAHEARAKTTYQQNAYISGTHSSVDYDFETAIHSMVLNIDPGGVFEKPERKRVKMPPLTNIVRSYYTTPPAVEIQRGGRIVKTQRR